MTFDFDALVAPLGASSFFSEYYEAKPLHLHGNARAREALLSWEELQNALLNPAFSRTGLLCFPEQIGATQEELTSDAHVLQRYVDAGHPIVWNRARALSPRIDGVCRMLAMTLGAHVWPNVYATTEAGTPFETHFDAHEVIAIHCEGRKTWDISKIRVNRPLEAAEMAPAIAEEIRQRSVEAAKEVLATFEVEPGDLVYIPRGQFHNARTTSGRSLHVTFGIELPTGFDLVKRICNVLLADPRMREYSPPKAMDPDGAERKKWLAEITNRIARAAADELESEQEKLMQFWIRKSSSPIEK